MGDFVFLRDGRKVIFCGYDFKEEMTSNYRFWIVADGRIEFIYWNLDTQPFPFTDSRPASMQKEAVIGIVSVFQHYPEALKILQERIKKIKEETLG